MLLVAQISLTESGIKSVDKHLEVKIRQRINFNVLQRLRIVESLGDSFEEEELSRISLDSSDLEVCIFVSFVSLTVKQREQSRFESALNLIYSTLFIYVYITNQSIEWLLYVAIGHKQ